MTSEWLSNERLRDLSYLDLLLRFVSVMLFAGRFLFLVFNRRSTNYFLSPTRICVSHGLQLAMVIGMVPILISLYWELLSVLRSCTAVMIVSLACDCAVEPCFNICRWIQDSKKPVQLETATWCQYSLLTTCAQPVSCIGSYQFINCDIPLGYFGGC